MSSEINTKQHPATTVIAGAGVAGCAAALALRAAGRPVLLIDKPSTQLLRVGESLPGAAIRLLRRLGISGLHELLPTAAYTPCVAQASKWYSPTWEYRDATANPEGGGWHLDRAAFDRALLERAISEGAEHMLGRIDQVQTTEHGFSIKLQGEATTIEAAQLIDATGRSAAIARQLGAERKRLVEQWAACTWITPPDHDKDQTTRVLTTPVTKDNRGWWYTAQLPQNRRAIVYHGNAQRVALYKREPEAFRLAVNSTDLLSYPIETTHAPSPILATDAGVQVLNKLAGENWIAIGDAAFGQDPIASQGMFFALYTAVRGTEALLTQSTSKYTTQIQKVILHQHQSRQAYYSTATEASA